MGVGSYAAKAAFDKFHGRWQLKLHPKNLPSVSFWEKTISAYTKGLYRLVLAYPGTEYDDGTPGNVYFFENE